MTASSVTVSAPEEELREKTKALAGLQQELTEKELLLSTCKRDLHLFEQHYQRQVGAKYAELDEIRASILELAFRLDPHREDLEINARAAREDASQSSRDARNDDAHADKAPEKKPPPTEQLKKSFREAARKIHPDLATDKKQRARRHGLMTRLNQAYQEMDSGKIKAILDEWEEEAPSQSALTVGKRLVRAIRQIAQVKERLDAIRQELAQLQGSEMYKLKERVDAVKRNGRDVIGEMTADIEAKISRVKSGILRLSDELTYL